MVSKRQVLNLERSLREFQKCFGKVWVVVVDHNGVVQSGWVDQEEYLKWHPHFQEEGFSQISEKPVFDQSSKVRFIAGISECFEPACPWHGKQ